MSERAMTRRHAPLRRVRCQNCQDAFDERAAILEYEGEYTRAAAERMALAELIKRACECRLQPEAAK